MRKIGLISLALAGVLAAIFFMSLNSKSEIVYIKIPEVYNSYQMTEDLENLFNRELEIRKGKIDEIKLQIDTMVHADSDQLEKLYAQYNQMSQRLSEFKSRKQDEIQNQTLGRISDLAREYGQEKGYGFILGANGNGSIMHASEDDDITMSFIDYINQEYASK